MAVTLGNLHVDILDRILEEMYAPYMYIWDKRWGVQQLKDRMPAAGLLPLSLVCKRLRAQILPWIFRDVTFSFRIPHDFFPCHLVPYIRVFRFLDASRPSDPRSHKRQLQYNQAWENLYEQLPHLENVHTIYLRTFACAPFLVCAVAALPQLSSLILHVVPPIADEEIPFHQFRGLRRLRHVNVDQTLPGVQVGRPHNEVFGKKLLAAVESSATSLVELDIPGGYVSLDRLGHLPLTALRTLVLRGSIYSPTPNLLCAIMNTAPNLRNLEVHLLVVDGDTPHFTVVAEDNDSMSDDLCTRLFSNLHQLTLANPDPFDRIFRHLPLNLQLLSLPAFAFLVYGHGREERAMSANAASHIITNCSASHLMELKFSVEGVLPPSLFYTAASCFPFLKKLEVRHRFRVGEDGEVIKEKEYLPADYATVFTAFQHLQELNVDWPLTNIGDCDDYRTPTRSSRFSPFPRPLIEMSAFASLIASSIPSLIWIRFREPMDMTISCLLWRPFKIFRSGRNFEIIVKQMDNKRPDVAECIQVSRAQSKTLPTKRSDHESDEPQAVIIITRAHEST